MKVIHIITWVLIIIGALNWGLTGLGQFAGSNWNVINLLIGSWSPQLEWIIYILVGLSGVWELVTHRKHCRVCGSTSMRESAPQTSMSGAM